MSVNAEFDEEMRNITAGLTGNPEEDFNYLDEQMQKYKDHPMGKEIARACGRIMASMIPEDKKEKMARVFGNEAAGITAAIEEAKYNIYQKDFDKARIILEGLIKSFEGSGWFEDDAVSEYHNFNEFFEEALYRNIYQPEKDLRQAEYPFFDVYYFYGVVLIDLKRFEDSIAALKIAMRWNPINFAANSEYREVLKMTGQLDDFFHETIKAFKIAYKSEMLAKCYRDLGFYFIEKEQYKEAMACYLLSINADKKSSNQAMSEMYYIQGKVDGGVSEPPIEEVREIADKYGFPIGPDADIVGLAIAYARHFAEQGQFEGAKYVGNIAYQLTEDAAIKEFLDSIDKAAQG